MSNKNKVLGNRVLIKLEEVKTKTESGLILTPEVQEKKTTGTVVSVGGKVEEVQVGDLVFYNKYSGTEIGIKGEKFVIVVESEIVMILENEQV
jgi:chaperonin GroES